MQHVIKKKKKRGLWPKLAIRHGQDLEHKLLDFRIYFNNHRTHTSREGRTPDTTVVRPVANLRSFRWQPHCRNLYQTPMAA